MNDAAQASAGLLLVGLLVIAAVAVRAAARRLRLPPFAGFLLLGFGVSLLDAPLGILTIGVAGVLDFLAAAGLVALLFKVGLETDVGELIEVLPRASLVWIGNVAGSAAAGWIAARYVLGLDALASVFVATALTATSVGVAVASWREGGRLRSREGEVLVDAAGLDDVSAVVLVALLLGLLPQLQNTGAVGAWAIAADALWLLLKLAGFIAAGLLFGRYLEPHIGRYFRQRAGSSQPLLVIAATGFIIAAMADLLGFSVAIGAFIAGVLYSRDPLAERIDEAFDPLYDLFAPFFFISIGASIDPATLGQVGTAGAVLLSAAVLGKLVGAGLPAWLVVGSGPAALIAISMVPRAEIMLFAAEQAHAAGVLPDEVFAAMAAVALVTSLGVPLVLQPILRRASDDDG